MAGDQTVVQHRQVGAERGRAGIGRGLERGGTRGGLAGQQRMGRRQPGVDFAQRQAIRFVRPVRRGIARTLGESLQFGADLGQRARQAQFGAQGVHRLQIVTQHRLGRGGEGGSQGVGVDIGIAVAVAADPGPDADEGFQVGRVQPPAPVHQLFRRHLQEHPLQEGHDGVDLVLHHQAGGPHQPRGPQDHRLATQAVDHHVRRTGQIVAIAGVQQVRHRRDPVDHALAPHLGRMGRQHRRDQGLGQQVARLLDRAPRRLQPGQRALGRVGPRPLGGLAAGPALARPVLGDIGQQGEDREPVRQPDRVVQRHVGQQPLQLGRPLGSGMSVIADRGHANRLDPVVQTLAALVADDVAQQAAQQPHLLAQAFVGGRGSGLDGHEYLAAGRPEAASLAGWARRATRPGPPETHRARACS